MQAEAYFHYASPLLQKLYPKEEAEAILYWVFEDVLLIKKAHLRLFNKELDQAEEMKLSQILDRLLKGEPIQYILGYAYFRDFVLFVQAGVLIPRPETEELVDLILTEYKCSDVQPELSFLDICSGSGCIAIALKKHFEECKVSAIDISPIALDTIRINAKNLNAEIEVNQVDVLSTEGQQYLKDSEATVWVCNPPYITQKEQADMHPNVLEFEPHLALFVPNEAPLLFYETILNAFMDSVRAEQLFFEISEYQEEALTKLLEKSELEFVFYQDLPGKTRMLHLKKI